MEDVGRLFCKCEVIKMKNLVGIKFLDDLKCKREKRHTEVWILIAPFTYTLIFKNRLSECFVIPENFESDGASVPRIFWSIFPPWGQYAEAAVLHDYHYRVPNFYIKKQDADFIFLLGMKSLGVNIISRRLIYWAVKYLGIFTWKKYRK